MCFDTFCFCLFCFCFFKLFISLMILIFLVVKLASFYKVSFAYDYQLLQWLLAIVSKLVVIICENIPLVQLL